MSRRSEEERGGERDGNRRSAYLGRNVDRDEAQNVSHAAAALAIQQIVRAGDESSEVEQLVRRLTARGRAQPREINRQRPVLGDEFAYARFAEGLETAALRIGEFRGEGDPARRARRDDRISVATRARCTARGGAAFSRLALARQQPRERGALVVAVVYRERSAKTRRNLRRDLLPSLRRSDARRSLHRSSR